MYVGTAGMFNLINSVFVHNWRCVITHNIEIFTRILFIESIGIPIFSLLPLSNQNLA